MRCGNAWARCLAETWTHASGAQLPLARFALDTGFATQEAYAFVRASRDPRVMAVKGVARGAALIGTPTAVDVSAGGKRLRRGIKVFAVAVGIAKLEFYNNLRKAADVADDGVTAIYPAGYVHLPQVDGEFIQQLCAEQLVTRRDRNGFAHARVAEDPGAQRGPGLPYTRVPPPPRPGSTASRNATGGNWNDNWGWSGPQTPPPTTTELNEATHSGGLGCFYPPQRGRRVIKSRWLTR